MHCLSNKMKNSMDAWTNEMELVLLKLIIDEFKLMAPGTKQDISMFKVLLCDGMLRHNLDTMNKFAEV